MRTPANRLWLFSALVAVASGTASLTFDASAFSGGFPATSIFDVYYFPLPGNRSFTWTSTVPVTIQNVCLGNDASHQIIGQENIVWGDGARSSKTRRDEFQAAPEIQLNISQTTTTSGSVVIYQSGLKELSTRFAQTPLIFQIQWAEIDHDTTDNAVVYYSYSQVWGLAENASVASVMNEENPNFNFGVLAVAQGTSALIPVSTQTSTVAPTIATSPSPSPTTNSSSSSSSSSSDASSSNSNSSHKYGLLSKNALIGAIVGGVAFLILILIAVFLCVRRHRKHTRNQQDHDRDAQDLMAEKEARAAGTAPDTPYSVDSSQPLHPGRGLPGLHDNVASMPRNVLASQDSQRSSAVYSSLRNVTSVGTGLGDGSEVEVSPTVTHPSSSISLHEPYADLVQGQFERSTSRATAERINSNIDTAETEQTPLSPGSIRDEPRPRASGSRTGTPQLGPTRLVRSDTPGGVSISDYLHEDGMTEDEIKRLEEEERALDEAIEQARTDSRAARGR